MKKIFYIQLLIFIFISCSDSKKEKKKEKETIVEDNRISLWSDTVNVVKLTDTMVIFESTCRGCAYEGSTNFSISDSLGIVKLDNVSTAPDNNSPDMAGGSISKTLVLVPVKTGTTTIKKYKFWKEEKKKEDSANFSSYTIKVINW